MINYTWKFETFDCVDIDELKNVIKIIRWDLTGSSGAAAHTVYGVTSTEDPNPANFMQFEDLTEEIAIEWVTKYEDIISIKNKIINNINNQLQVTMVSLSPPWIS